MKISRDTKFFGILGFPLGHTLSPVIHNGLFEEYNFNGLYIVFEKEKPSRNLFFGKDSIPLEGLSVTIPHKEWAFKQADHRDEASTHMQASNTLVRVQSKLNAYNTDGYGAIRSIEEYKRNFFETGKGDILILGSGGSAKGISYSLVKRGLSAQKIVVAARNEKTGKALVQKLNSMQKEISEYATLESIQKESKRYSLIINTTPVGMKGKKDSQILSEDFFIKSHSLFDIVYNPLETPLVKLAKKKKVKIIPGYEMLLYQAMEQFRLFTGIRVDNKRISLVRKWLLKNLK
ncbi:MAG TPA: shikimate dehydrogenase [Leptospiraceae bacterium]|nr:shikimate dehydrogenase [Leptospiraceae bacterium]HMW07221.1 shikimate dehydrogenase [Leptospiraceae bacterium]HMX33076.1 shikimate dehydrogenase [Leptospiraceae bacterium]HMY32629.1 shikimate dehydrogenase [Leptospiraceae bacterium]HMZ63744.1 shikimate dehydrogenase [Leptospiraceae bacterium]